MLTEKEFTDKIDNKIALTEDEIRYAIDYFSRAEQIEGKNNRWTQYMDTIVQVDGRFFDIPWESGLTEMQENCYDDQPYEVERIEKVITRVVVEWNRI